MCEHYRERLVEDHRHYINALKYNNCVLCVAKYEGPMSKSQAARYLGVSKVWLAKIEERALIKLKRRMQKHLS